MKELITKQWTIVNDVKKLKEKTESEQWGTVYAVEYGEHLKIGFTKDLIRRVKNFLHQSRYNQIKVNKIAFTPFHSNFNENERMLHKLFKTFRIKGTELFSISLNEFLEKVPELQLDKTIVDYKDEIKDLVAGQQKKEISSTAAQIQVYEDITLPVREYNGERIVTFEDIDFIHNRPTGTAGRNFRKNKKRLIENIDYFFLTFEEVRATNFVQRPNSQGLILITKMGYLMLVKSFTDDKAWLIQRLLVVNYFDTKSNKEEELGTVIINLIENKDNINMGQINNMITDTKQKEDETKGINMDFKIDDLKKMPVWVNWKLEERDGKKTKVPYNPRTGGKAMSNNRDTWTNFDYANSKSADYSGIGFMFADGICGIDIDNKTGNPDLDKQAETIIALMNTYTERSPSGTGWHIIFKCDMSKIPTIDGKLNSKYYYKNPHNDLECYFPGLTNRYFTYTGEVINDKNIEDRTEQILIFIENYMLKDNFKKKKESKQGQTERITMTGTDIIDKIRQSKQGYKFSALYDRGDTSAYNNDDSAADEALCYILAWWLQGDFNEIDRYFRQSRLYREKWERADYRTATINKAINDQNGNFYNPPGRPKSRKNKQSDTDECENDGIIGKKITIAGVKKYLEQFNISIRYNEITRKTEIQGFNDYNENYIVDNFPIILYDQLNLIYEKCSQSDVQNFLKVIMMNDAYNPVLELIESSTWDGKDRLPELYSIMKIDDSDTLSKILIYKWLWQNLSMLRNNKGTYGADGLLVLKGDPSTGKSTFARKAALKDVYFGDGLILDVRDKDSVLNAVSCWVGELGEIESTFKSDINALKAFITRAVDQIRVPYGRTAEDIPRRTSFIGTANSDQYLIDETGNRRYWTIPINERMDLDALKEFDMLQLYLQIDKYAKNDIQGYRLTPEEKNELDKRNNVHEKPIPAEFEIMDILFVAEQDSLIKWEEMTITEFKELYVSLKSYTANQNRQSIKKSRDRG